MNKRNQQIMNNLEWLKENYFSSSDRKMMVKKGEIILQQGAENDRLFYVESGKLTGYHQPREGSALKIFCAGPKKMAGIYSFFSPDCLSYTTVMADEDAIVYYAAHKDLPDFNTPDHTAFSDHILPIVGNEIYLRQNLIIKNACEKELAMKKLMQSEKLATLGQLAAGLAHELNNAIGVLQNKTAWMTEQIKSFLLQKDNLLYYDLFLKGLEQGQSHSTAAIRKHKEALKKQLKIDDRLAKKLAKINLSQKEIELLSQADLNQYIENLDTYWETGLALHDMRIAATHTTHVIRSIKDLGSQNKSQLIDCDIRLTFNKSLALLSNLTKLVTVDQEIEPDLKVIAREGDLIQIWVNLVKNAIESLLSGKTDNPTIHLVSENHADHFLIYVIDNGPGIPAHLLPSIFQPNFTTKVEGMSFGLGLGLSIVQKLISGYGGIIEVKSQPGKTEFKIELPKI